MTIRLEELPDEENDRLGQLPRPVPRDPWAGVWASQHVSEDDDGSLPRNATVEQQRRRIENRRVDQRPAYQPARVPVYYRGYDDSTLFFVATVAFIFGLFIGAIFVMAVVSS